MARVHLTFDNGPDPEVTPRVLRILQQRGLRASFFVLGKHLATPAGMRLAHRIHEEGHRLGNHSFSHEQPLGRDPRPDAVAQELARTDALLSEVLSDDTPRWFRPVGGGGELGPHLFTPESVAWLGARTYTCALWTSVPGDWLEPVAWVDRALADADATEHGVVVLHDILPEAMGHLERFLDALEAAGHTCTDRFPEACLPMVRGEAQPGLERYVSAP